MEGEGRRGEDNKKGIYEPADEMRREKWVNVNQ